MTLYSCGEFTLLHCTALHCTAPHYTARNSLCDIALALTLFPRINDYLEGSLSEGKISKNLYDHLKGTVLHCGTILCNKKESAGMCEQR